MTDLGLANSIELDQSVHIMEVLKRFNMNDCNLAFTPADTVGQITNIDDDVIPENIPYPQAVGALLFIAQATRPDIAFAVNVASRYNNNHSIIE